MTVCGEEMRKRPLAAKRRVGYLPEELYFYQRLTGREYLRLVAGLKGADEARAAEEAEFFELKAVEGKWVGGYSLGMRKKLGLAAAFIGAPRVLVLDEPLNGLDVEMMRKLRLRIERERDAGARLRRLVARDELRRARGRPRGRDERGPRRRRRHPRRAAPPRRNARRALRGCLLPSRGTKAVGSRQMAVGS